MLETSIGRLAFPGEQKKPAGCRRYKGCSAEADKQSASVPGTMYRAPTTAKGEEPIGRLAFPGGVGVQCGKPQLERIPV